MTMRWETLFEAPATHEQERERGPSCPPSGQIRETVSGFPRYQQSAVSLPRSEKARINRIANLILKSFGSGCTPVGTIRLIGHADRDIQRGPVFERAIGGARALEVQNALLKRIDDLGRRPGRAAAPPLSRLISWQRSSVGATRLAVQNPVNEAQRARNRRVEIVMTPRATPGPIDVRDRRLDVAVQAGLRSMLYADPQAQAEAREILAAVKQGNIAGIHEDDGRAAVLLTGRRGATSQQVIPPAADAVLTWTPTHPSAALSIVFRHELRLDSSRLEMAVRRAWAIYQQLRLLRLTAAGPAASGAHRRLAKARASGPFASGARLVLPVVSLSLSLPRALDPSEIRLATGVFGASLDFSRILISPLLGLNSRPFTLAVPSSGTFGPTSGWLTVLNLGPTPYKTPASNPRLLIHELTHSWQSQHHTSSAAYEANSLASQAASQIATGSVDGAYCYVAGKSFGLYGAEQIAQQVENGVAPIIAHVKAVPLLLPDPLNIAGLALPHWETPGAAGVTC